MRERLPKETYRRLMETVDQRKPLDLQVANVVATAMKDWAVENGATHYTHWFQPLTGLTAEKHDSLVAPDGDGGMIFALSGSELCQESPTRRASRRAGCAPRSRRAGTRPGTPRARRS